MKKIEQPESPYQLAEIQVSYKPKVKASERPQVKCSEDAHKIFLHAWDEDIDLRERFYIMLLNQSCRVLGVTCLSVGGITGTVADKRLAMGIALKGNAVGMILAHNHPSGEVKPSKADDALTREFKEAGKAIGVDVRDHLVLGGKDRYYSYTDDSPFF